MESTFDFDIVRSGAVVGANCLQNARGHVKIQSVGPVEVMDVSVSGLPPNKEFDFFIIQVPNGPFGDSWYQGDLETDGNGNGSQRYIGRFNIETFFVAPGTAAARRGPQLSTVPGRLVQPGLQPDPHLPRRALVQLAGRRPGGRLPGRPDPVQRRPHGRRSRCSAAATSRTIRGRCASSACRVEEAHDANNDDEEQPLSEDERRNKEHGNRLGKDDYETQGDVVEVHCDASTPEVVIANRDGNVVVRILAKSRDFQCSWVKVGDYLMVDSGEKQNEQLYDAYDLTLEHHK